jgi:hypothetical protein
MNKLDINSIIDDGKFKGKKVSEVIKDKKKVFSLIKDGFQLSDDVLAKAGIKKNIYNVKVTTQIVEHEKDNRVYPKETMSVSKIIKELETVERQNQFYDSNNDKVLDDLSE